jgi:hypothetical protein
VAGDPHRALGAAVAAVESRITNQESRSHPFPPVVRWALFPALAAFAGSVGGALGAALILREFDNPGPAIMAGALGAGASFASMLTTRSWPAFIAAPALSVSAFVSGFAILEAIESGYFPAPWLILTQLTHEGGTVLPIGFAALAQTATHRIAIQRSWVVGFAAGAGFAVLTLALVLTLLPNEPQRIAVAGLLSAATLAQVPAILAARGVARRLRPREVA